MTYEAHVIQRTSLRVQRIARPMRASLACMQISVGSRFESRMRSDGAEHLEDTADRIQNISRLAGSVQA